MGVANPQVPRRQPSVARTCCSRRPRSQGAACRLDEGCWSASGDPIAAARATSHEFTCLSKCFINPDSGLARRLSFSCNRGRSSPGRKIGLSKAERFDSGDLPTERGRPCRSRRRSTSASALFVFRLPTGRRSGPLGARLASRRPCRSALGAAASVTPISRVSASVVRTIPR